MRLSCSSAGSVERWRDTIFVNRLENSLALIRCRFFDIFTPALSQPYLPTISYQITDEE